MGKSKPVQNMEITRKIALIISLTWITRSIGDIELLTTKREYVCTWMKIYTEKFFLNEMIL